MHRPKRLKMAKPAALAMAEMVRSLDVLPLRLRVSLAPGGDR